MAKKGVLVSDPSFKNMNPTQWLFELESLNTVADRRYEDIATLLNLGRKSAIELLGLNIMPVEEDVPIEEGGGPDGEGGVITRLRPANEHEIVPLVAYVGQAEMLSTIAEKYQEMHLQDELDQKEEEGRIVRLDPDELDEFIDGDIAFPDDPEELKKYLIWNSEETKATLNQLVKPLSEKDIDLISEASQSTTIISKKKKAKVSLE